MSNLKGVYLVYDTATFPAIKQFPMLFPMQSNMCLWEGECKESLKRGFRIMSCLQKGIAPTLWPQYIQHDQGNCLFSESETFAMEYDDKSFMWHLHMKSPQLTEEDYESAGITL
jgi:hypothetical protein